MFITLEGGEGAGKGSVIKKMENYFQTLGLEYMVTFEPGGTRIGEIIRGILKSSENKGVLCDEAEIFLFMAGRMQHLKELILPSLENGKIVVSDRYYDSTRAYQGAGRRLHSNLVEKIIFGIFEVLVPDLTFLLDLSPEVGLARNTKQLKNGEGTKTHTRFEEEMLDFHYRLRQGYLDLAKKEPNRFCIVDAEQSKKDVWKDVKEKLDEVLKQ